MKKFYVVVVCVLSVTLVNAQTRFWVGPATGSGGLWSNTANWSTTSGGAGGASVPNGSTFDVIFDQGAVAQVDVASGLSAVIDLNSLTVTNSSTATIYFNNPALTGGATLTLHSTSTGSPALNIGLGSTLIDSSTVTSTLFSVTFAAGAQGLVNGTWYFTGAAGATPPQDGQTTFTLPATAGQGNRIDINGVMRFENHTLTPNPAAGVGIQYLFFNSGSTYWLNRNGGNSPRATYDPNSTIQFTGITNSAPIINIDNNAALGNVIYDCPGQTLNMNLGLPTKLKMAGNFNINNTNGLVLSLAATTFNADITDTISGNFTIGSAANVLWCDNHNDHTYSLTVGNFNLAGSFALRGTGITPTLPVMLQVRGNFSQTGGTFTNNNTTLSSTTELFVLEMGGSSAQTFTSSSGTIDNAQNQVTFRMNNAAGVTLLSPLSVGKLSWNSTNKGNLVTTSSNILTVNNSDVTDNTVVNGPSSSGFVSGPITRKTAATGTYRFPTGKGSSYRYLEVIPNTASASSYTVEYFGTAFSDLSSISPVTGVSNLEYWNVTRNSGSSAVIQLNLNGTAVPGAAGSDNIAVAIYNGMDWVSDMGATGTFLAPGNTMFGTVKSDVGTPFGFVTFGFGPAGSLPINLLTFNAKKVPGSAALLNWTITESSTPDHFEVLRSTDGINYTSIGSVNAIHQVTSYSYTDNNLPYGNTYYRLRMVDVNGLVSFSKVVAIVNTGKGLITSMMPTLVTGMAKLNVSSSERGSMQLVITDVTGRIVMQQSNSIAQGNQEIWLNLTKLPAGTYQVTGYMDSQAISTIRFIKQ